MNPQTLVHVSNGKMTANGDSEKTRVWGFISEMTHTFQVTVFVGFAQN